MDPLTITASGILILLGLGIGAFFRFGPGKMLGAMSDALLGTPDVKDRRGAVISEGTPGLVALQRDHSDRLRLVEEAVVEFRHSIALYTELAGRMDRVENDVKILKDDHIKELVQAVERASTAASAASVLRMAEGRDPILDVEPEEAPDV